MFKSVPTETPRPLMRGDVKVLAMLRISRQNSPLCLYLVPEFAPTLPNILNLEMVQGTAGKSLSFLLTLDTK